MISFCFSFSLNIKARQSNWFVSPQYIQIPRIFMTHEILLTASWEHGEEDYITPHNAKQLDPSMWLARLLFLLQKFSPLLPYCQVSSLHLFFTIHLLKFLLFSKPVRRWSQVYTHSTKVCCFWKTINYFFPSMLLGKVGSVSSSFRGPYLMISHIPNISLKGFSGGSVVKHPPPMWRLGFDPWIWKIP